ncbi:MAG: aminotransferase class I/II-fold pyridoxal phosphate-dependent enzyme, partial [Actinomycetota bacterium]
AMGVRVYPSDANFILFETQPAGEGSGGTKEVWAALLERGVLVRDYSNHPSLSNCLRVTAGTAEETTAFLEAVEEVLGAQAAI